MEKVGFGGTGSAAIAYALPITGLYFLGTIAAVLYVESIGRRKLLIATTPILTVCMIGISAAFYLINFDPAHSALGGVLAMTFGAVFIIVFAIGMGSVPWIINSEIYKPHLA
jgi:K+ transporter